MDVHLDSFIQPHLELKLKIRTRFLLKFIDQDHFSLQICDVSYRVLQFSLQKTVFKMFLLFRHQMSESSESDGRTSKTQQLTTKQHQSIKVRWITDENVQFEFVSFVFKACEK